MTTPPRNRTVNNKRVNAECGGSPGRTAATGYDLIKTVHSSTQMIPQDSPVGVVKSAV